LPPLVRLAEEVARAARLPPHAARELASRVPAAAARPGTSRNDDLEAVLALLERAVEEARRASFTKERIVP